MLASYCYLNHEGGTKDYLVVAIWDPDERGSSVLYTQWGKVGTKGQHKFLVLRNCADAQIEMDRLIWSKENRGYHAVQNHRAQKPSEDSRLRSHIDTIQRRCPEFVQWLKHDEAFEEMEQVMAGAPTPRAPRAVEQLADWGDW